MNFESNNHYENVSVDMDYDAMADEAIDSCEEIENILDVEEFKPHHVKKLVNEVVLPFCEALTDTQLFYYQRAIAAGISYSVLMNDGATITALVARQCIGGDEIVFERDGSIRKMKESSKAFKTGHKMTYKVKAKGGYQLDHVTKDHMFATPDGWKELHELKEGDTIVVATDVPQWRNDSTITGQVNNYINKFRTDTVDVEEQWTVGLAKLLGYLTADGYMAQAIKGGQSIKFTNITPAYLDEFERLLKDELGLDARRVPKGKGYDIYASGGGRYNRLRNLAKILEYYDKFPVAIFNTNEKIAGAFVNRLTSADGYVYPGRNEIGISCGNSITYARCVQALLLKLGIRSTVKEEWMKKSTNYFYRVLITGRKNVLRFRDVVGEVYGKEAKSKQLFAKYSALTKLSKNLYKTVDTGQDSEALAYSTITSITPNGEMDVYDREVPDKQWFICNGFKLHNSGKSETLACISLALGILIPKFSKIFKAKNLKAYRDKFHIGVYGPDYDKSAIIYNRMKNKIANKNAKKILASPSLGVDFKKIKGLKFPNGFQVDMKSASKNTKIEGFTFSFIIIDEAQDIDSTTINRSIRPMKNFYNGTMVYIGTPRAETCAFSEACFLNIKKDEKAKRTNDPFRLHYQYDYTHVSSVNPQAKKSILADMEQMGEDSDEFRMAYKCEWLQSRGKHISYDDLRTNGITNPKGRIDRAYTVVRGESIETKFKRSCGLVPRDKDVMDHAFSIDYGSKRDSTVMTIGRVWWDNPVIINGVYRYHIHILDWLELKGDNHDEQYPKIITKLDHYNPILGADDATGVGDPLHTRLAKELQYKGIDLKPFIYSQKSKHEGYMLLKQEISAGRVTFPWSDKVRSYKKHKRFVKQCTELVKEYKGKYMHIRHPNMNNAHDDYPDSLMQLVWVVNMMGRRYVRIEAGTQGGLRGAYKDSLRSRGSRRSGRGGNDRGSSNRKRWWRS